MTTIQRLRKHFEQATGLRTYADKGIRSTVANSIFEADSPWADRHEEAVAEWLDKSGLAVETRKSRMTVYAPEGWTPPTSV